jgi:hypothetical protein
VLPAKHHSSCCSTHWPRSKIQRRTARRHVERKEKGEHRKRRGVKISNPFQNFELLLHSEWNQLLAALTRPTSSCVGRSCLTVGQGVEVASSCRVVVGPRRRSPGNRSARRGASPRAACWGTAPLAEGHAETGSTVGRVVHERRRAWDRRRRLVSLS